MRCSADDQGLDWERHDPSERAYQAGIGHLVEKYKHEVSWNALLRGSGGEIPGPPEVGGHEPLTEFVEPDDVGSQPTPDGPSAPPRSPWDDPAIAAEDRTRKTDDFPDRPTGAAAPVPPPEPVPEDSGLRRILVLQDLDDPIITEDGSEIILTAGDVESCPAAIADNLIAAGLAEPAPL